MRRDLLQGPARLEIIVRPAAAISDSKAERTIHSARISDEQAQALQETTRAVEETK